MYEPGSFRPLALVEGNAKKNQKIKTYWYQNDHLGTPHSLTDSLGNLVYSCSYNAYGKLQEETQHRQEEFGVRVETNLRFQGQYWDEETGLHYNRYRYYDFHIGRYITQDPLGILSGLNIYQYVNNNPIYWIDALGLVKGLGNNDNLDYPLFRGTSEGYAGGQGAQRVGITPASTDPAVSSVFATESNQYGNGVLYIARPSDLKGVEIFEGNVLAAKEAEVGVSLLPIEFADAASIRISASDARNILKDMDIHIPAVVRGPEDISRILGDLPKLTSEGILEFVLKAEKINQKGQ
ncbi:RHS repeat domain-containing protein [Budvicia aquatica]|uniref:RHS repeat domain-containing protein n=1 Tax=Budvicia aquatica TaxID=82979 RepID=UPI00207E0DC5|nr:RHS repeat-associated core domain-containing protein [Budvicia aquatica]GKX53153.1 hypothetical protein SOASR029_34620 [Budvicia aquatica]